MRVSCKYFDKKINEFGWGMENPHHWIWSLKIINNFQIFMFLESLTKLPCLIYDKLFQGK
jgi:hypothetical protein